MLIIASSEGILRRSIINHVPGTITWPDSSMSQASPWAYVAIRGKITLLCDLIYSGGGIDLVEAAEVQSIRTVWYVLSSVLGGCSIAQRSPRKLFNTSSFPIFVFVGAR